jgi:hypothetical protein
MLDVRASLTATPIIITPDMGEEEIRAEWELMLIRSYAAADFNQGKISVDDYLDTLAECGVDVDGVLDTWEYGGLLMTIEQ